MQRPSSRLFLLMLRRLVSRPLHPYACFFKISHGPFVWIDAVKDHPFYAGIDKHLGAERAGRGCTVKRAACHADPLHRCLDDGILLSMQPTAELVTLSRRDAQLFAQAAHLTAMG